MIELRFHVLMVKVGVWKLRHITSTVVYMKNSRLHLLGSAQDSAIFARF